MHIQTRYRKLLRNKLHHMNKNFNIFRLNCLLNDTDSTNFNGIILSLIHEVIFVNDNAELSRTECYKYISYDLKIKLELDLFYEIIEKAKTLIVSPIEDDLLIKLKPEKYKEISDNIQHHSIERYIRDFVKNKGYGAENSDLIFKLLTKSIYENINSFTISNIKSIITDDCSNGYYQEQIDIFNEFIDYADHDKQNTLYNTFLKAIEFAVLTSGKGIKEFSKEIFKNKDYALDTNIIFRLIGIGGSERQKSTKTLMHSCIHQGVSFFYSIATYKEFKRKVDSSKNEINHAIQKGSLEVIQDLLEQDIDSYLNDDFLVFYARLKKEGKVKSPEQLEQFLVTEFKKIEKEFKLVSKNCETVLKKSTLNHWQSKLYDKKKEKNDYTQYTKSAAKVDATNILYVRHIRGNNKYNYSDVKSFYLTTDRTLNTIMAEFNEKLIPETILPSQLFILHNSLSDNEEDIDYETFSLFLKRRTTEYKISGREILTYVDEIRQYTTESETIEEVIKAYSDIKYNRNTKEIQTEQSKKIPTIKEFTKTYLDLRLQKAEFGDQKYKEIYLKALAELPKFIKTAKNVTRLIDILITILLIPLTVLIVKKATQDLYILAIVIVLIEAIKFIISSRSQIFFKLMSKIYLYKVKKSPFFKVAGDDKVFLDAAIEKLKLLEKNIWKK